MKENKREKGIENHPLFILKRVLIEKNLYSKKIQYAMLDSLRIEDNSKYLIVPVSLVNRINNELEKNISNQLSPDFLCYIFAFIFNRQKLKVLTKEKYTDVNVSSILMRNLKSNYNLHIQYLEKNNFIKRIKNHSNGSINNHPRKYVINVELFSENELCIYKVSEKKIIKLLEKKKIYKIENDDKKLKLNFKKNQEFLSKIKLAVTDDELKSKIEENYSSSGIQDGHFKNYLMAEEFMFVKAFNDNTPIYSFQIYSELTGRIYDSFKNLKSNLKQLFKVNNQKISDFDISNSHPLFLMFFLTKELMRIIEIEIEEKNYNNKTSISNYELKKVGIELDENMSKHLVKLIKSINLNYNTTLSYLTIKLNLSNIKKQLISLINTCFEGKFYNEFIETKKCKNQDANNMLLEKENCKLEYMFFENAQLNNDNFIRFSKRFQVKFPDLFKLFIYKRIENYIQFSSHKNFGFELTKIESKIRLQVMKKYVFRASKNQIFDMHDGFLIEENPKNVEKIKQAYKQSILKLFKDELDFLFPKEKSKLNIKLKQKS
jgi:hypothetical protein